MNRIKRIIFKTLLLPLLLITWFSCAKRNLVQKEERPNIVFILLDDLGYGDLSVYGNSRISSPNIDKVAREGIRFTNFYANSPVCSPSRVAFITGSYPFKFGIHGVIANRERNEERGQANFLDTTAPLLPKIFKENEYSTAHFGKWHMGGGRDISDVPYPTDYGFDKTLVGFEGIGDRILDKDHFLSDMSAELGKGNIQRTDKHRITEIYVDSALAFISRHKESPFYINLFPGDVHDPFKPPNDSVQKYLPMARDLEEASFFAVLRETDRQVGRFLKELESMGVLSNTIVIISSDNGPTDWPRYYKDGGLPPSSQGDLRGRKWSLYEGGIRVPLIVKWQNRISPNQIDSTTLGMLMDLFPTYLSLAGIQNPEREQIDGQDLKAAFLGKPMEEDRAVFWYFPNVPIPGNPEFKSPQFAVRHGDWKFLMEPDGSRMELYNLEIDPQEKNNVVDQFPEKKQSLQQLLKEWRRNNIKFTKDQ